MAVEPRFLLHRRTVLAAMVGAATAALVALPAPTGSAVLDSPLAARPALIALHPWLVARLSRRGAEPEVTAPADQIVIAGFGLVGRQLASVLRSARTGYRLIDLDPHRVRAARDAGEPVTFGDASQADIQRDCGVPTARACVFLLSDARAQIRAVRTARSLAPAVPILARAHRHDELSHRYLAGLGVHLYLGELPGKGGR